MARMGLKVWGGSGEMRCEAEGADGGRDRDDMRVGVSGIDIEGEDTM